MGKPKNQTMAAAREEAAKEMFPEVLKSFNDFVKDPSPYELRVSSGDLYVHGGRGNMTICSASTYVELMSALGHVRMGMCVWLSARNHERVRTEKENASVLAMIEMAVSQEEVNS